jgi:hypothetical protein
MIQYILQCILQYIQYYNTIQYTILQYCGVAPKGRSIERPLLINGYASVA